MNALALMFAGGVVGMKRHTPHRPATKYYDKYGGEDVGDGW